MTHHESTQALVIAAALAMLTAVGCSFSESSKSSSDSSGSFSDSSDSSSDSSGSSSDSSSSSSGEDTAYRGDIETYTIAALEARDLDDISDAHFMRELGAIAEDHSITDWEASTETYYGVGRGLRRAGFSREQALDFHRRVFGPDSAREAMLLHGHRDAGRVS